MKYDIFISYKRISLPTANNLYYRLTTRGYSAFFDLEEMRKDNFNVQLLEYIENSKDVFVLLEEGSLAACKNGNWEEDWFCKEIAHALKTKKNIIPILIGGYQMPKQESLPNELKELALKNAPEFSFSYFEEYLNKLIEKDYITSEAQINNQTTSIFKFYSGESCKIFKEGKLVCSLTGMSEEPYYLPVFRKGDYRFKVVNDETKEVQILNFYIDTVEEKSIEINWKHDSLKRHLFEKRKGCYVTIIVLFLAVLIVLPLRMAFDSAQSASPVVVSPDSSESKNEQMSIVEHTDTLTIDLYLKYAVGSSKLVLDTIAKQKIDIVVKQIERRKANLKNIEIITGFSPEGSPAINQKLAMARAEVLADYLKTYIGDVETTVSYKERNWKDVSEILRKQGHISEADAIDGILQDTEHYMQIYTKIRQIPTYYELISPVLSKLRYTTCLLEVVRFEVRNSDMPL